MYIMNDNAELYKEFSYPTSDINLITFISEANGAE